MKAKATALLLADLGVTRSHNRPHVSNDNLFSESHFKTLSTSCSSPSASVASRRRQKFLPPLLRMGINQDHHHSGIGLMTPDQVHYGLTEAVHAARQTTLSIRRSATIRSASSTSAAHPAQQTNRRLDQLPTPRPRAKPEWFWPH